MTENKTEKQDEEWIDVSLKKDGGVLKRILKEGKGDTPKTGYKVNVHYTGKLENGVKFDSSRDRKKEFSFNIGSGVIQGWSIGVATMKKGEHSVFKLKPEYAYGAQGAGNSIPPNATLTFDIELLSFEIPISSLSQEERLNLAKEKKDEGNAFFKQKDFVGSAISFKKVTEYLEAFELWEPKLAEEARALSINTFSNFSLVLLKLGDVKNCINICTRGINELERIAKSKLESKEEIKHEVTGMIANAEAKSQNKKRKDRLYPLKLTEVEKKFFIKLLFRRSKANSAIKAFKEALNDLNKALINDEKNTVLLSEKRKTIKQIKLEKKRERIAYGNLFEKLGKMKERDDKIKAKEEEEIKKLEMEQKNLPKKEKKEEHVHQHEHDECGCGHDHGHHHHEEHAHQHHDHHQHQHSHDECGCGHDHGHHHHEEHVHQHEHAHQHDNCGCGHEH